MPIATPPILHDEAPSGIEHVQALLQRSDERHRVFVEQSSDAVWCCAFEPPIPIDCPVEEQVDRILAHGYLAECNDRLANLYGFDHAEDLAGAPVSELLIRDAATLEHLEAFVRGGHRLIEADSRKAHPRGGVQCLRGRYIGIREGGLLVRMWVSQHDLTERNRLEEALRQAQKMDAVGRLAGGVAHDFNNMLAAIQGFTTFVYDELPASDPLRADLAEVLHAADRAAALTRQLLTFSRKQRTNHEVLDLNASVTSTERMLRRLIGEDIQVTMLLEPALGHVRADAGEIEQIVLNLVVNARDAMPSGGALTLETANVEVDEDAARSHVPGAPGSYVMLTVSDTGCGMDEETKSRVFEPFFTTKAPGKGTGLGLSTVFGIVKQSGAQISVHSDVGHGSTFKIYFPRAATPAAARRDPLSMRPPGGTETVLLVEDEPSVRMMTRRILEKAGYRVLEARSGEEALLVARRRATPIDLVLTDVVMPRMNGWQLVEQLRASKLTERVIMMSGYSDDLLVRGSSQPSDAAFLAKPFAANALLQMMRQVLDAAA